MLKKTLAAVVVAGALLFTGASAANADYTPGTGPVASDPTPAPGETIVITVTDIPDTVSVATFATTGAGATLSSIVLAASTGSSVDKDVVDATASANFVATEPGTYTVTVTGDDGTDLGSVDITVAAAGGDDDELPSTGGTVPAVALWVGAGALGLGGLAVVAATARRRASQN